MAENRILPFGTTNTGSNLLSQAEYEVDRQRLVGNEPGVARSALVNKVLRQSSLMAAGLGTFMARHAAGDAGDVEDTMTPGAVADYLSAVIAGMAGAGAGGLPDDGEPGQALVMGEDGPEWQFISGIPIGQLTFLPYDEAPAGFAKISHDTETLLSLAAFADAVKLACPAAFNDEADYFYRCNNADGTGRSAEGEFLVLPAASRYFFRGFDADGGVGQYQYQEDAMQPIQGTVGIQGSNGNYLITEQNKGPFYIDKNGTGPWAERSNAGTTYASVKFDSNLVVRTANETRPMNIAAFRVFIKLWDDAHVPAQLDVQALVNAWTALSAAKMDRHEFEARLESDGYLVLPGGLILQWCSGVATKVEASQEVVYPIAFPKRVLCHFVSTHMNADSNAGNSTFETVGEPGLASCRVYLQLMATTNVVLTPRLFLIGF